MTASGALSVKAIRPGACWGLLVWCGWCKNQENMMVRVFGLSKLCHSCLQIER
jgi:hypothetical protein